MIGQRQCFLWCSQLLEAITSLFLVQHHQKCYQRQKFASGRKLNQFSFYFPSARSSFQPHSTLWKKLSSLPSLIIFWKLGNVWIFLPAEHLSYFASMISLARSIFVESSSLLNFLFLVQQFAQNQQKQLNMRSFKCFTNVICIIICNLVMFK